MRHVSFDLVKIALVSAAVASFACSSSLPQSPALVAASGQSDAQSRMAEPESEQAPADDSAPVSAPPPPSDAGEPEASGSLTIPAQCADPAATLCAPPAAFIERLCKLGSADTALRLFSKGTPWKRAYLRLDIDAWYAGAQLASPQRLAYGEEVIVLANRASSAAMQIGQGGLDVVRWDGRCVSVMADEVTFKRPASPRVAPISWTRLGEPIRAALETSGAIRSRRRVQRERCNEDREAPRCTEASSALSELIADYVRRRADL
jgi:hypothetical protein